MDEKFKEIDKARKILELGKRATLREIREAYHQSCKKYHPDTGGDEEKMKEVNWAHDLLKEYCETFSFPLTKEEFEKDNDAYTRYMKGFQEDWMWTPVRTKERKSNHGGF